MELKEVSFPCQCECGHLFLETYKFKKPTEKGVIGFCWCGFCRTRFNLSEQGLITNLNK